MSRSPRPIPLALLLCLGSVGLLVGGLLIGYEPVGGDPDRMYRPLKQELARTLQDGRLPWWSERFGLGLPLLAESHVAALYPPNWLLYGMLPMPSAYRIAMWAHYVLLAAATYGYARFLGASGWGAALAGVAFPFCGFQAIHSSHEPFYHALAYLPLTFLAAEWYLAGGRWIGLLLVAGLWGLQITLGHFQLQWWTGGLVLFLGLWRAMLDGRPWLRAAALVPALTLGASIAAVQLGASGELASFVGHTNRSVADLAFYGFPPEHLAEAVIPGLVREIPGGPEAGYWQVLGSTGYEACFYVGTIPLILALLSLSGGVSRPLRPWAFILVASLVLAVLPRVWPAGQLLLIGLPGFGWFRAPGRYTALASLGLCLLAASGLDTAIVAKRLRLGWSLVASVLLAALGWSLVWALHPANCPALGGTRLGFALGAAVLAWGIGIDLVRRYRTRKLPAAVLLLATAFELGVLYYSSTTTWGWTVKLPEQSPVLARLAMEPAVGGVAGLVHNLPVRAGDSPIYPYTGFNLPWPHPFLDLASRPALALSAPGHNRLTRYGATHGIWDRRVPEDQAETLLEGPDPVLDGLVVKPAGGLAHATWRLVRYRDPFPAARAAIRARISDSIPGLTAAIDVDHDPRNAWFLASDRPPAAPATTAATVVSFDGRTAVVEHDGSCLLVLNRTFYPGWYASVNGGEPGPVQRVELGIQCVSLPGKGPSRVVLSYRPAYLRWAGPTALAATAFTLGGLVLGAASFLRGLGASSRPDETDRE